MILHCFLLIASGWTLDQWKDFLNPLISWEHAAVAESGVHKDHEIKLTIRSLLPKVGGLSDDKLADDEVNALFDDKVCTLRFHSVCLSNTP